MDLADLTVPASDGGSLIHFLSDQQWSAHWLLYVGDDGSEAVVSSYPPHGFIFDEDETHPDYHSTRLKVFDVATTEAVVCSETLAEFTYRYWIENEIFLRPSTADSPVNIVATPSTLHQPITTKSYLSQATLIISQYVANAM